MKRVSSGLIVCFLLFGLNAWAIPQLDGVSGTFEHGASISISGQEFGTKPETSHFIYDDVESGEFNSSWGTIADLDVGTESRHGFSSFCGTLNMQGSLGESANKAYFSGGQNSPEWFAQYWFRVDENFDFGTTGYTGDDTNLANLKIFRLWSTGSTNENFYIGGATGFWNQMSVNAENIDDGVHETFSNGVLSVFSDREWHNLQLEFKDSDQNVANGLVRLWLDGQLQYENMAILTREDSSDYKRPFFLGFYDAWNDGNTDRDDFYIDDAYIDNSRSRVEVGNSFNYADCTHREIQPYTTWADGSVELTFNQGSFLSGDEIFFFVVDSEGNASEGFPITVSGSSNVIDSELPEESGGCAGSTSGIWVCLTLVSVFWGERRFRRI